MVPDGTMCFQVAPDGPDKYLQMIPDDPRLPHGDMELLSGGSCFTGAGGRFSVLPGQLQIA